MKVQAWNKKTLLILCFVSLVFLVSCVDLTAIRKFADTSADSAGYTSLTTDYINSIERLKRYQEEKFYKELDKQIEIRQKQKKPLLALHKGVEDYMHALGALASDDLVSYDKSLGSLSTEIKNAKLPGVEDKQVQAISGLTKLLAKAFTDGYRRAKLEEFIKESNSDFQSVIAAMTTIAGEAYVSSLDIEIVAVNEYYKNIVKISEKNPPQQASIELLKENWKSKIDAIDTKKQSCVLYTDTLKKIGQGHQSLFDNCDKLNTREFKAIISGYKNDIETLNKSIKDLK